MQTISWECININIHPLLILIKIEMGGGGRMGTEEGWMVNEEGWKGTEGG